MSIRLVADGRGGRRLIESATGIISSAYRRANRVLASETNILVKLIPSTNLDISKYMGGASGWTKSANAFNIYIDAKSPTWLAATERSFVHEFNHAIRHQRFRKSFKDYTLLDTIASEGLAQCFEKRILRTLPPYAQAISLEHARRLWQRLKPHLHEADNDLYRRVFFATADREFAHWSGYTISYLIVRQKMLASRAKWPRIMREDSDVIVGRGLD